MLNTEGKSIQISVLEILLFAILIINLKLTIMMTGNYSPMHVLSDKDRQIFEAATQGICGVGYEPLVVSEQVVAGTNYCFICNATAVVQEPFTYPVKVIIFVPLPGQGDPVITEVTKI